MPARLALERQLLFSEALTPVAEALARQGMGFAVGSMGDIAAPPGLDMRARAQPARPLRRLDRGSCSLPFSSFPQTRCAMHSCVLIHAHRVWRDMLISGSQSITHGHSYVGGTLYFCHQRQDSMLSATFRSVTRLRFADAYSEFSYAKSMLFQSIRGIGLRPSTLAFCSAAGRPLAVGSVPQR